MTACAALALGAAACGGPADLTLSEDVQGTPVTDAELSELKAAADARAATAELRLAPPDMPTSCGDKSQPAPLDRAEALQSFTSAGKRHPMLSTKVSTEEAVANPTALIRPPSREHVPDSLARGVTLAPIKLPLVPSIGTVAALTCGGDEDHDGWWDGPCNERRKLVLRTVRAVEHDEIGHDEVYVIADDVRFPNADMDGYWSLRSGESKAVNRVVASRVRGVASPTSFAKVVVKLYEDDFEVWNEWTADDLFGKTEIDLGALTNGQTFTRRITGGGGSYDLAFEVQIERFADPTPGADGDADGDGIRESAEFAVSRDFGGIADPQRKEVFVEVDVMQGHALPDQVKGLVTTQYFRHGIKLHLLRDELLARQGCLSVPKAKALYTEHFGRKKYGAFRYAVIGEELWNDASGVSWADAFFVDDSTWWIDGKVLPLAGTFIHELGHGMSLRKPNSDGRLDPGEYKWIDGINWLSYHSAMNYTFQPTVVDYSGEGAGGDTSDHNDWQDVDPRYALRWSFGAVTSVETGHCAN